MNPFYRPQMPSPAQVPQMPNLFQMIQQFNQFRQTFQGDPRQKVEEMLRSGQVTQEQFEQAKQMTQQISQFFR